MTHEPRSGLAASHSSRTRWGQSYWRGDPGRVTFVATYESSNVDQRVPRVSVGGPGYETVVAEPRDEFPNNFVGDLVQTERGWVVMPPTCCAAGHDYGDGGWSVSSVWCTCNGRHMEWRCHCGATLYAPHCRLRDRGPVSVWEDEQRG